MIFSRQRIREALVHVRMIASLLTLTRRHNIDPVRNNETINITHMTSYFKKLVGII